MKQEQESGHKHAYREIVRQKSMDEVAQELGVKLTDIYPFAQYAGSQSGYYPGERKLRIAGEKKLRAAVGADRFLAAKKKIEEALSQNRQFWRKLK